MKKLVSAAIAAGMILASASPVFAANQCANQTTGPGSTNRCTRKLRKVARLEVLNLGKIIQRVNTDVNTGGDHSDYNTSGGAVDTGKAEASVFKAAQLNTGDVAMEQSDPASDDTGLNDVTGPGSTNMVLLKTVKTASVGIGNIGRINQVVSTSANSGRNTSSYNTVGGSVTTDDATANVEVQAVLNDTVVYISQ